MRFVEALGIIPDATDPPCSVPSEPVDFYLLGSRTADQAAILLGSSRQTLVRVPERRARKVPFAAVACGAIAIECMGPGDLVSSPFDPRRPIPLHPPAPWLLGLGTSGEPVFVNPIPGATIAVTGPDAEMLAASAPTDHPFLSAPLFLSDGDATAFRDAYSPHVCRLVVSPPADGSIPVDVVADSRGWIEHCGATIRFTPMQASPARGMRRHGRSSVVGPGGTGGTRIARSREHLRHRVIPTMR